MFLPSPPLGIDFSDEIVRVVLAKGQPFEALRGPQAQNGKIMQRSQGKDLEEALAKLGEHPKKAVICLPPEKVYTILLHLPPDKDKEQEKMILQEVAKAIPEEIDDLTFVSKVLTKGKEIVDIGVVAVRKDVLQSYTDACNKAGLKLVSALTVPVAAASLVKTSQVLETFLLVTSSTFTVFHRPTSSRQASWPIDEALFPEGAEKEKIKEAIKDLQNEYSARGIAIEKTITLEEILPWLPEKDREWAGATAASLAGKTGTPLSLLL